jgi:hypothetical protein
LDFGCNVNRMSKDELGESSCEFWNACLTYKAVVLKLVASIDIFFGIFTTLADRQKFTGTCQVDGHLIIILPSGLEAPW